MVRGLAPEGPSAIDRIDIRRVEELDSFGINLTTTEEEAHSAGLKDSVGPK